MVDMNWLDQYLLKKTGAIKDYKVEWEWTRYMVGGKMYAATCCPGPAHAKEYAGHPLLTLKCDPIESGYLREQYSDILPGFYMNKKQWISILVDGDLSEELLQHLCDTAYDFIFAKLTKKLQQEIKIADQIIN